MADTARRAFVSAVVIGGVVVLALALWKLRILIALLFLAFIIAAAMRPGIEIMKRWRVPRGIGIAVHYLALGVLVAILLSLVVPRALNQVQNAVEDLPTSGSELEEAAQESTGIRHELLVGLQRRLEELPAASELVDPAVEVTFAAFEVLIGIFFVLATAAYWIFEREKAVALVTSLLPRPRRKKVRDTWNLIDLKLGAYVRGQALLIMLVGTVLSLLFLAIGLPYWILIGAFAGVVEIVPVIGPLAAGALAVGVGLTVSWQVAAAAGIAVLVVRLLEDYLVIPRVLGDAVGLSPLLVLVAVTSVAILFGEFAVLLAIPIAAVVATLVDVIVLNKDPAEEDVPTVIFSAQDVEPSARR
ncbi:MAG: AI-2E family transporter [Gaiellaceae bacterium]